MADGVIGIHGVIFLRNLGVSFSKHSIVAPRLPDRRFIH